MKKWVFVFAKFYFLYIFYWFLWIRRLWGWQGQCWDMRRRLRAWTMLWTLWEPEGTVPTPSTFQRGLPFSRRLAVPELRRCLLLLSCTVWVNWNYVVEIWKGDVLQQGNRSSSSACGSADVLEALGVVIDLGPEVSARYLLPMFFFIYFFPIKLFSC